MTDSINPQPDHKVLEIGTGSGYQSAFLAELSGYVYTIEIVEPLAKVTDEIYESHYENYPQYQNIRRRIDDGYYGWPERAPFDRIIVTAGIDHIPPPLLQQLAPDGIMVIPVGPPSGQKILKITKRVESDGTVALEREDIYEGTGIDTDVFVPFTKQGGGVHSQGAQ
jgi:protein-L-isoaspartate(D-aspartate) O-methyltransferase